MNKLEKLESIRGFASIYVAIGHFILNDNSMPKALLFFFKFGQEAVIIFFILSGFVIFYSFEKSRDKSLISYFVKRFRRIYFPFICAIILSILIIKSGLNLKQLIGNLLMLQDYGPAKPGNIVEPFLGNAPLWSLSYEWVFYLIFPFVYPAIKDSNFRVHIIGFFCILNLIIYVLFPNHIFLVLSYFIIWWTGLELAEYFFGYKDKKNVTTLVMYYVFILVILTIVCYVYHRSNSHIEIGFYPYLVLRHIGFAFLCLFLSLYLTSITKKFAGLLKPFKYVAPISYSIYILHYPILIEAHFNLPTYIELPIKILLLIGLSYLIEIVLQPVINKYVKAI